jgi:hypothetical protein
MGKGPGSAISGQVDQGQGGRHRRRVAIKDDQAKKSKRWPIAKNEGNKLQQRLKATLDILMAKNKEGRASIRGCKN